MTLKRILPILLILVIGLGIVLIGSGLMSRPSASSTPTPRPTDLGANLITRKAFPSLSYGIQVFIWWNEATRPRDLELVRMMRFGYVKQIFGWKDIRPLKDGQDQWANADEVVAETEYRGLKLIARLGKPPDWAIRPPGSPEEPPFDEKAFGVFCGDLAQRYKGKIAGYQVWNEPNLDREWGNHTPNAASYVRVLAECYKAIKAADPDAVVISAGLAPTGTLSPQVIPDDQYLIEMYRAGLKDHYDVLGLNAPGYQSAPTTDPASLPVRWQAFRHVEDMRAIMVAQGDGAKQIAILEMGWTTDQRDTIPGAGGTPQPNPYRWHAVGEKEQAQYLVEAYEYAAKHWRPWVGLMSMIYVPDPAWTQDNEEYWWAITDTDGFNPRRRAAFFELANTARYIDDTVIPPILDGVNPYVPLPPRKK